jgi:hypothetical protein
VPPDLWGFTLTFLRAQSLQKSHLIGATFTGAPRLSIGRYARHSAALQSSSATLYLIDAFANDFRAVPKLSLLYVAKRQGKRFDNAIASN